MERFVNLEENMRERKGFHKHALERIRDYYSLPGDKTGLKNSPHDIFMKRAGDLIFLGFENLEKVQYLADEPVGFIFIGVGTEILLKSIILKENPNYFIKNINIEKGKTLSYQQCCDKLNKLFKEILTAKQAKRIKEVLELIQQKRNNLVHLGFHRIEFFGEEYQIAHALEFLFSYFFKENANPIVQKLREFKEKKKVVSGMDYEHVDFL